MSKSQYLETEKLAKLAEDLEESARIVWNDHLLIKNHLYASYVMEDLIAVKSINSKLKEGYKPYPGEYEIIDDMCERYGYYDILEEVI